MKTLLAAGALSMVFTLFMTPVFIRLFKRLAWGQFINMDGVPNGDYRLVASTNVLSLVAEDNFGNNSFSQPFRVAGDTVTLLSPTWSGIKVVASGLSTSGNISDVKGVSPALHRWDSFGVQENKFVHLTSVRDVVSAPEYLDAPAGTNLGKFGVFSRTPNTIDLFASASGQLYWRRHNGTSWGNWVLVPTVSGVVYGISLIARPVPSDRIDAFYMDGLRNLGHATFSGGVWTSENLGKPAASLLGDPAAVSTQPGTFDVFLQGGDSKLWRIAYNGSWSSFSSFATPILVGSPAAVVRTPGTIDVAWRNNSSQLAYMAWNGSSWGAIQTFTNPSGVSVASPPALAASGPDQLFAAVSGSDDRPYFAVLQGTTWSALSNPTSFGAMHFRIPTLVSWANNRIDLLYSMTFSRVGQLSWF
jgi:hypothetical protein